MSLGPWPEAAASDIRAATTAVRSRVRTNMKTSVLDDGAWPLLIMLPIFCPPQLDGSADPQLLCTFRSFHEIRGVIGNSAHLSTSERPALAENRLLGRYRNWPMVDDRR